MTQDIRVSDPAPAVSVILPTYQRRELVGSAVASVLAQTYRDFELIVVDDGSGDGTAEALAPLTGQLRYQWQPNRGVAAARNAGLRIAHGSIVAFLDSDDRWLPDHLAVVTEVLDRLGEVVLVTTSPRHAIGGKAGPGSARIYDPLPIQLLADTVGYPSCVAARRKAVVAAGGFDERMLVGEDAELFMRLALRGPFGMLHRRTIIKGYTRGLTEWGIRRGHYLETLEYRVTRALEELRMSDGARASELSSQARGALAFVAALRALETGDERAIETLLGDACRLLPQLSREPEIVEKRFHYLTGALEPSERLRCLTSAAALWPDPHSDTALFLRLSALTSACAQRSQSDVKALLAGWPLRPTPAFARRALPIAARRTRQRIDARVHRVEDGVDLDSRDAVTARIDRGADASSPAELGG